MYIAIICEFNPITNGHEYLIKRAKELSQLPVLCLMSGDFVQRGEPAILDKYTRAHHAIAAGADVVLELPTIYSLGAAEKFASGAIKILNALGCVSHIIFGSECGNIEQINSLCDLKLHETETLKAKLKAYLDDGYSYSAAMQRAMISEEPTFAPFFEGSNNILGLEYVTAIKKQQAYITPLTIKRKDNGYNSTNATSNYASSSLVRKLAASSDTAFKIEEYVPSFAVSPIITNPKVNQKAYETLIINKIRENEPRDLEKYFDYNEGIEYRIKEMCDKYSSLQMITEMAETKRYRSARINKLLIYPLLGITKQIMNSIKREVPAVKVLAMKNDAKNTLSVLGKNVDLIVRSEDIDSLQGTKRDVYEIDLRASNLYNLLIGLPNNMDKKIGTLFI